MVNRANCPNMVEEWRWVKRDMEADIYSKLVEDGAKKIIYKMPQDRD